MSHLPGSFRLCSHMAQAQRGQWQSVTRMETDHPSTVTPPPAATWEAPPCAVPCSRHTAHLLFSAGHRVLLGIPLPRGLITPLGSFVKFGSGSEPLPAMRSRAFPPLPRDQGPGFTPTGALGTPKAHLDRRSISSVCPVLCLAGGIGSPVQLWSCPGAQWEMRLVRGVRKLGQAGNRAWHHRRTALLASTEETWVSRTIQRY